MELTSLTLPDLTPNPGMWWYFFTEMFDHFRPFFLMVFSVRTHKSSNTPQNHNLQIGPSFDLHCADLHQIPVSDVGTECQVASFDHIITQIRPSIRCISSSGHFSDIQSIPDPRRSRSILEHDRSVPRNISL